MTLTLGTGPFGRRSEAIHNLPVEPGARVLLMHPYQRRVRAQLDGRTVVDSHRGVLLHETGHLPVGYFPLEDFGADVLEESTMRTHCPVKGEASYFHVRVGAEPDEDAVWQYPDPVEGCPPIAGLAAVYWDAMDAWFEEDERVFRHLRDPFHRVDARRASLRVRVEVAGQQVADTSRPVLVFETGLPVRYYLPPEDVRTDLLEPSPTVTRCPYKGRAAYWMARTPGGEVADVAWSYPEPLLEAQPAAGYYCFHGDEVRILADR